MNANLLPTGKELLRSSSMVISVKSPTTVPLEETDTLLKGPALKNGWAKMPSLVSSTQCPSPVLTLTTNELVGGRVVSGLTNPPEIPKQYSDPASMASGSKIT